MSTKTITLIAQTPGYNCPGTEEAYRLVGNRVDVDTWTTTQGFNDDNPDLFVAVTGAAADSDEWDTTEGHPDTFEAKVDILTWAKIRKLEADRHLEYNRPVEATRILKEVRVEVDAHLRAFVKTGVAAVVDQVEERTGRRNITKAAQLLGLTDTAVNKWLAD